jgi:hypothetical protein
MERPPAPPEAVLIRLAREAAGIPIAAAAERAGVSVARWSQIEAGSEIRHGQVSPVTGRAGTIARMAGAIPGISPERLASEGQRPDAAEILGEIERQEAQPSPHLASVPVPPPASAEALIEAIRSKPMRQMGAHMAEEVDKRLPRLAGLATGAAKANPGTPVPSGAQVFGPGENADLWDELVARGKQLAKLGLTGPDGFDLEQMLQAMVIAQVQVDDSRRDRRGGAVAQLIRR